MAAHCPLTAFLCLAGALLTAGAAVGNYQGCPEGWTPFGTRCFKFFDSNLTWTEAEKSCQSHGANLASIHSAEENAFIVDLIEEASEGHWWWTSIGGKYSAQDKLWTWTDGSVWDYSNWAGIEQNGFSWDEGFVAIYFGDMFWDVFGEDIPLDYIPLDHICAKDAPPKA